MPITQLLFKKDVSFFDLISLLDKIQRPYKEHCLTSIDLVTGRHLYDNYQDKAAAVYVTVSGAYSVSGFPYKSKATVIVYHHNGGQITRQIVPEALYGHGPVYRIDLIDPRTDVSRNVSTIPVTPDYMIQSQDADRVVIVSRKNTASLCVTVTSRQYCRDV
jgi:hypothetical protein